MPIKPITNMLWKVSVSQFSNFSAVAMKESVFKGILVLSTELAQRILLRYLEARGLQTM